MPDDFDDPKDREAAAKIARASEAENTSNRKDLRLDPESEIGRALQAHKLARDRAAAAGQFGPMYRLDPAKWKRSARELEAELLQIIAAEPAPKSLLDAARGTDASRMLAELREARAQNIRDVAERRSSTVAAHLEILAQAPRLGLKADLLRNEAGIPCVQVMFPARGPKEALDVLGRATVDVQTLDELYDALGYPRAPDDL